MNSAAIRVLGLLALLGPCFAGARSAAQEGAIKVGAQAPVFFMNTYNPERCGEQRVFLEKLVGPAASTPKKVVLINFFSIDCKPCKRELPLMQKLFERYRERGLGVLVVNSDTLEDRMAEAARYIQETGFTFPVLKDRFQALQRRYGVSSFPSTFLVDDQGVIQDIRVGFDPANPLPLSEIQKRIGAPEEKIEPDPEPPPQPIPKTKPPAKTRKPAGK
jgi:thiol-disulfide isomerase/thioredoxin